MTRGEMLSVMCGIVVVCGFILLLLHWDRKTDKNMAACHAAGGIMLERTRAIGKTTEYRYTCIKADVIINVGE